MFAGREYDSSIIPKTDESVKEDETESPSLEII